VLLLNCIQGHAFFQSTHAYQSPQTRCKEEVHTGPKQLAHLLLGPREEPKSYRAFRTSDRYPGAPDSTGELAGAPHPVSYEDEEAPAQGLGLSPGAALDQLHQKVEEAPKGQEAAPRQQVREGLHTKPGGRDNSIRASKLVCYLTGGVHIFSHGADGHVNKMLSIGDWDSSVQFLVASIQDEHRRYASVNKISERLL
jgi:hypothetical protein